MNANEFVWELHFGYVGGKQHVREFYGPGGFDQAVNAACRRFPALDEADYRFTSPFGISFRAAGGAIRIKIVPIFE